MPHGNALADDSARSGTKLCLRLTARQALSAGGRESPLEALPSLLRTRFVSVLLCAVLDAINDIEVITIRYSINLKAYQ